MQALAWTTDVRGMMIPPPSQRGIFIIIRSSLFLTTNDVLQSTTGTSWDWTSKRLPGQEVWERLTCDPLAGHPNHQYPAGRGKLGSAVSTLKALSLNRQY
ncbi:hypothetical protein E2C01_022811 [Portunus trituberculatus]|uniref:Uncharacterized protein n=1 Tax=Portunus trituberculatus TaxID=210409 RepID=A0A5B7E6D1_PORTR|nr:hypothetical protein [Portunus trituberculatus]